MSSHNSVYFSDGETSWIGNQPSVGSFKVMATMPFLVEKSSYYDGFAQSIAGLGKHVPTYAPHNNAVEVFSMEHGKSQRLVEYKLVRCSTETGELDWRTDSLVPMECPVRREMDQVFRIGSCRK
jgi:hypothetical protein